MKMIFSLIAWLSVSVIIVSTSSFHDNFAYHNILDKGMERIKHKPKMEQIWPYFPVWNTKELFGTDMQTIVSDPDTFLSLGITNYNVTESCMTGMKHYFYGLRDSKMWAIKMFDSSAKLPSGILQGDLLWPGQFDQCVNISADIEDNDDKLMSTPLQGKYFSLSINTSLFMNATMPSAPLTAIQFRGLTIGVCLPSNCTETDVDGMANAVFYIIKSGLPSDSSVSNISTLILDVSHPEVIFESRPETIIAILFSSVIAFLVVIGTLYDYFIYQSNPVEYFTESYDNSLEQARMASDIAVNTETTSDVSPLFTGNPNVSSLTVVQKLRNIGKLGKILLSFSFYTNGSKVLNTNHAANQILAVNGIRVLSMGWVILGHTFFFSIALLKNIVVITDWIKRWSFQAVLGGFFAVDSFYLLSGLLVTYLTLTEMKKKSGKFNWLLFYFHRFWRLTPAYMLILLMYTGYFQYWSDGPFWPDRSPDYKQCTQYWWRNLLYIQNFFPVADECMGWSWYLANDMQYFIISPLILIPLYRKPLIGYVLLGVLFLEQFIFRGVISYHYQLKMNGPQSEDFQDWFDYVYQRPYARISPYLVGMVVGYIMWKTDRKVYLPKVVVILGWIISLVCVTSVVYGTIEENRGYINSLPTDAVFNSLCKTVWSLGLGWIVFACNTGYGGIITSFLSSPLWGPLSRLTYCAYLIHPIIMYVNVLSQRYPIFFSDLNVIYLFFGNWMLTYLVAFVVSLTFEAPLIGLERVFLGKK